MTTKTIAALLCLCGIAATVPPMRADEADKKTIFTFSGPVEIPGQVLAAGTYVFKLADTLSSRSVVQVFNKNETHLIGTFLTIPDYRMKTPDKPLIRFDERAAGSPEAIKSWFYPGDNYGNAFVYPKTRASQLAAQSHQSVPSMPSELASNTTASTSQNDDQIQQMKAAPLKAQKPSGDEAEISEVFVTVEPPVAPAPVIAVPVAALVQGNASPQLPETASTIPLFASVGMILLIASAGLGAMSRRVRE